MDRKLKAAAMWFYRKLLRIPWMEHINNEEVWRELETKITLILWKERLENLIPLGHIEGKKGRRKW